MSNSFFVFLLFYTLVLLVDIGLSMTQSGYCFVFLFLEGKTALTHLHKTKSGVLLAHLVPILITTTHVEARERWRKKEQGG